MFVCVADVIRYINNITWKIMILTIFKLKKYKLLGSFIKSEIYFHNKPIIILSFFKHKIKQFDFKILYKINSLLPKKEKFMKTIKVSNFNI